MKVQPRKRKLSVAARAAMGAGGRKASRAAKRRAGRLGWLAMLRSLAQTMSPGTKSGE